MELPKLTMIDFALKLEENSTLLCQSLILPLAVDSSTVFHKDVTEDKSELLGHGSRAPELSLEEISEINKLVILTPCKNVDITSMKPNIHLALKLKKSTQLVTQLALETTLTTITTNTSQLHLMD